MTLKTSIECVLFDLDGTLVDTAPDFVDVVNQLLSNYNKGPIEPALVYSTVSDGARALVKLSFKIEEKDEGFLEINKQLLELYERKLDATQSVLYPGLPGLLTNLDESKIPWGIVTNKPWKYSEKLLAQMNLLDRCSVLICPDHVSSPKPNPEPILVACKQLGCATGKTVYIGDHLRDIQAAKSAEVIAIAAAYGYLHADAKIEEWQADFIVKDSTKIQGLLGKLNFR
ncbi:MAG: HAD-IA family hydrolase [Gammaproteobacteria bacterium]|nr:HAD-IA family hydrolase [Gammaproteobacteria bacterium]